ncbi:outer membrane protein assembly factor BamA [Gammaproteobacteria bacterium]|nr:outer membrane protein assembly factor BamA [Gammaproteobacteria bacterium]
MFFRYFVISILVFSAAFTQAQTINRIHVKGNQAISESAVIEASGLKIGQLMTDTGKVIQRLNNELQIETATVLVKEGDITLSIKELPRIVKITVNVSSGVNKELVKRILKEYEVGVNQVLDYGKVQKVVDAITAYIERSGYNDVDVSVDYKILANHQAILVFDMSSQQGYTISGIQFNGQHSLSQRQLEQFSGLSTTGLLSPITGDDYYSAARLQVAVESIKEAYANKGYYGVKITPSIQKISSTKQVKLVMHIQEGVVTKIGEVQTKHLTPSMRKRLKSMGVEKGKPLARYLIRSAEKTIANDFKDEGRYATDVNIQIKPVSMYQADLAFMVHQAPRVNIRFIHIEGNSKTEDQALRRYLDINEGELFSQSKVERSMEGLKALAFLEDVKFKVNPVQGQKNQVDLLVQVKEASSSTIALKGSYDQRQGIIFSLQYSDKNFLGTGNLMSTNLERAVNGKQSYILNWSSPTSLINTNWSESMHIGYDSTVGQIPDVDQSQRYKSTSFHLGLSEYIPIDSHLSFIIGAQPEFRQVENAKLNSMAYLFEQRFGRSFQTWGLKAGLRGRYYDARVGSWDGDLMLVHSPKISNSVPYTKLRSRIEGNLKLMGFWDQNVMLNPIFKLGYGVDSQGGGLPYFEKFQMGSDVTIRGFDTAKVGPYYEYTSLTTDALGNVSGKTVTDYVGGSQFMSMNLNLWLPSPSPESMTPGLYADVVHMNSEHQSSGTRYASGLTMKINSPMGLVQVAYALAVKGVGEKDHMDRFWISMSGSL